MNRSAIRELTFKVLYSQEIQEKYDEEQIDLYFESNDIQNETVKEYVKLVSKELKENEEDIISIISSKLTERWNIERISKVDLTLLKLAIYEIKYKNIPYKVEINEVVELAKKYAEKASPSFINGILASFVNEMENKKYDVWGYFCKWFEWVYKK